MSNQFGEILVSLNFVKTPGKARFFKRMETAITDIKQKLPNALYLGVSDGAQDLWLFLKKHTSEQILDFYHQYLRQLWSFLHLMNPTQR